MRVPVIREELNNAGLGHKVLKGTSRDLKGALADLSMKILFMIQRRPD